MPQVRRVPRRNGGQGCGEAGDGFVVMAHWILVTVVDTATVEPTACVPCTLSPDSDSVRLELVFSGVSVARDAEHATIATTVHAAGPEAPAVVVSM